MASPSPYIYEENYDIIREWVTVRQHDEDLDIDIDQTSILLGTVYSQFLRR